MNTIQTNLRLILEGTYVIEGDVYDLALHAKEKMYKGKLEDYRNELQYAKEKFTNKSNELKMQKSSGTITASKYLEEMITLRNKGHIRQWEERIKDIEHELEMLDK
jgi:hypothetical protein